MNLFTIQPNLSEKGVGWQVTNNKETTIDATEEAEICRSRQMRITRTIHRKDSMWILNEIFNA